MEKIISEEFNGKNCIYKITNIVNGKVYIGSSVKLKERINSHINKLETNIHLNTDLQKEWNVYESKNFTFDVLEVIEEKSQLPFKEKEYIDLYKKQNGVYNKSDPTEEFWLKRNDKKAVTKEIAEYKLSKSYILGWLDGRFSNLIKTIQNQTNTELYYDKYNADKIIFESIDNQDILNDPRLEELLHKWFLSNHLYVINFPNHKKEFRETFGVIVEHEAEYLLNKENYSKIYKQRKGNILDLKEMQESYRTKTKILKSKKETKKEKQSNYAEFKELMENKFSEVFGAMNEKLKEPNKYISFNKIADYLYKRSGEEFDQKYFNDSLRKYIRNKVNASIFNFESEVYYDETLENFKVPEREVLIMSKEKGKEISAFNTSVFEKKLIK